MARKYQSKVGPGLSVEARRRLVQEFEMLGVNGSEARVLLALLSHGVGTGGMLAVEAGMPSSNVYPVLESLRAKGVIQCLSGTVATWTTAGREAVIDRLVLLQRERLRQIEEAADRTRQALAAVLPDRPVVVPYVEMLPDAVETRLAYDRLLAEAKDELLMFTRPPYLNLQVDQTVLEAAARGLSMRVLYDAGSIEAGEGEALWRVYHAAGVQGRVVDDLAVKLMVFDKSIVMVGLTGPVGAEQDYPIHMVIRHPGYARVQAGAFEHAWALSREYPPAPPPSHDGVLDGRLDGQVAAGREMVEVDLHGRGRRRSKVSR